MKIIESNHEDSETIHKVSVGIYSYVGNKLLAISEDEIFFQKNFSDDTHKFKHYLNTNLKHINRKIGNISMNIGLKTELLNQKDILNRKDKLFNQFSVKYK